MVLLPIYLIDLFQYLIGIFKGEIFMELSPAIQNATNLRDLLSMVREIREEISFWGYRYLYIPNSEYTGKAYINDLALRVMKLARLGVRLNEVDREAGRELVQIADRIFLYNDNRTSEKNLFTRMLCKIRDLITFISNRNDFQKGLRFDWDNGKDQVVFIGVKP